MKYFLSYFVAIVFISVLAVTAITFCFVSTAKADVETKVGGKMFTSTGITITAKDLEKPSEYNVIAAGAGLSGLSRVNFTTSIDGKKRAFVEIRPGGVQHAYGAADFVGGELLAGKTESLFDLVWGRTTWGPTPLLIGWGKAWGGRIAQLRYTKKLDGCTLKIGLAEPNTSGIVGAAAKLGEGKNDIQHAVMPRIEAAFGGKIADHTIEASALCNITKAKEDETGWDEGIIAYGVALVGKIAAADVAKITANAYYGQNIGFASRTAYTAKYDGGEVKNAMNVGGFVDAEIKLVEKTFLIAGFGAGIDNYPDIDKTKQLKFTYFGSIKYGLSPNMSLKVGYNANQIKLEDKKTQKISGIYVAGIFGF